jgi:hypothetical protein
MSDYPECEKWAARSRPLLEFLQFLGEEGLALVRVAVPSRENEWQTYTMPYVSHDNLVCKFLDIDPKELERERRTMLAKIRDQAIEAAKQEEELSELREETGANDPPSNTHCHNCGELWEECACCGSCGEPPEKCDCCAECGACPEECECEEEPGPGPCSACPGSGESYG